jgi:signal transduction histidine kinase
LTGNGGGLALAGLAVALIAAIGAGLAIARLLMQSPADELLRIAAYLGVSGIVTVGGGWLLLRTFDRPGRLSLRARVLAAICVATAVAMANVFATAWLMFISTGHDLPLLAALLVFSALVTVVFAFAVTSGAVGRLRVIGQGIDQLAAGRYGHRIDASGQDDLAQVAGSVNELASRLEAAERRQAAVEEERRELTAAISHDLRTPLASVRAMIEALDDGIVDDDAGRHRYYVTMRREIERLARMMDDLFDLDRLDAGALALDRRPIALHEVAAEVVDAMQAQAVRCGVRLSLDGRAGAPIPIDGTRIERVIANLVRNALEHTPAGGTVTVSVWPDGAWVRLEVADTGHGIDADELPRIWDRFHRGERSRPRSIAGSEGAGLGLAIVRGIVEAHGGTVCVDSSPGDGARFMIALPA